MNPKSHSLLIDRYVPLRKEIPSHYLSCHSKSTLKKEENPKTAYSILLSEQQRRCLSFSIKKTSTTTASSELQHTISTKIPVVKEKQLNPKFVIRMEASKIVYAPEINDNYFSHNIDWCRDGRVGIGVKRDCYLYRNGIAISQHLYRRYRYDYTVTSIKFNHDGNLLFVGCNFGDLQAIDLQRQITIRYMNAHQSRISCIENTCEWGLLTGSKDRTIAHHDLRMKDLIIMRLVAHKDQVCGITLKNNKIASGDKNGIIKIWNLNNQKHFNNHKAHKGAVKALQWCPWRPNTLASGGGSSDHKIVLWNSLSEEVEEILEGKSQITDLVWRESTKDLVTSHGGNSKESYAMIWNSKIKEFTHILTGHKKRILGLAVCPTDQSEICTLGADESMRFWNTGKQVLNDDPRKRKSDVLENPCFK